MRTVEYCDNRNPTMTTEIIDYRNRDYVDPWATVLYHMEPLAPLFDLPDVTDIEIDRHDEISIVQHGQRRETNVVFPGGEHDVYTLIRQIANALDQPPPSRQTAFVDARLPNHFPDDLQGGTAIRLDALKGARISARAAPRSVYGSSMNIRLYPPIHYTLQDLLDRGTLTQVEANQLQELVEAGKSIAVVGGMGSGKSTLLRCLVQVLPPQRRLGIFEDTFELNIQRKHLAYVEVPQTDESNDDMVTLMEKCLRMNLESVVLGEIRSSMAAYVFYRMLTVGIGNCMSTWHAKSADIAPTVLADLLTETMQRDRDAVTSEIHDLLGAVSYMALVNGRRRLSKLAIF
jgi:Flp pilus assembly CpaF family ATPase